MYGEGGVYKTLGWEPSPNDAYHSEYLKSGDPNILNMPKIGEWHCNICNRNYSASNKSKHERTRKHTEKLEEKRTQSDGEVLDIGYYNNKITFP